MEVDPSCDCRHLVVFVITSTTFSLMAWIGVLILIGVAVNSGIVLIDRVIQLRTEGWTRHDAIVQAGPDHLRPISLTPASTILGLISLCIGPAKSVAMVLPTIGESNAAVWSLHCFLWSPTQCEEESLLHQILAGRSRQIFIDDQTPGHHIVKGLFPLGKSGHKETDVKDDAGNDFAKVSTGGLSEGNFVALQVCNHEAKRHFAECGALVG